MPRNQGNVTGQQTAMQIPERELSATSLLSSGSSELSGHEDAAASIMARESECEHEARAGQHCPQGAEVGWERGLNSATGGAGWLLKAKGSLADFLRGRPKPFST